MSIDVQCDGCGQAYRVGGDKAGLKLRCKVCNAVTLIPATDRSTEHVVVIAHAEIAEDSQYQPISHRSLTASKSGRLKQQAKKKKPPKQALVIGAAVAGVAIVALGAFFTIRALRPSKPADDSHTAIANTAPEPTRSRPAHGKSANGVSPTATTVVSNHPPTETVAESATDAAPVPSEKLKKIGLAFHNYAEANGALPKSASFNPEGKPLLSWRVLLLPYLGEEQLFKQFRLEEPWDSAHNATLIAKMPNVYAPSQNAEVGKTRILVFTGPETMFNGQEVVKLSDVKDGLSNTLLAVEATSMRATEWTRPKDLKYDGFETRRELGFDLLHRENVQLLMGDGKVIVFGDNIPPMLIQSIVTRAAGDRVPNFQNQPTAGDSQSGGSDGSAAPSK